MQNDKNKKDEIYWKVLNCAIELDFRKGHLKWTMTELSRKSKITRSLIYYYFGRSKMSILEAAIDIIGKELAGVDNPHRMELWRKGEFEESMKEARAVYDKMPYLCAFYLNYRDRPNEIGESLLKIEKAFKQRIKNFAPKATEAQINTLHSVYFGICFSPLVGDEEIKIFSKFIKSVFFGLQQ